MELKYYTTKEIAELLEVKQSRVRGWIREGWLRAERGPRRAYLIRESVFFNYAYQLPRFRELLASKLNDFRIYEHVRRTMTMQAAFVATYPGVIALAKRWAAKHSKSEEG